MQNVTSCKQTDRQRDRQTYPSGYLRYYHVRLVYQCHRLDPMDLQSINQ